MVVIVAISTLFLLSIRKIEKKTFEKSFGSLHFIWFERNMHADRMMRLPELVFIVEKQNAEKQ